MAAYPDLPARYSNGTLKLRKRLRLPEGAEVRVTITVPGGEAPGETPSLKKPRRKAAKRTYRSPTRHLPPGTLEAITGLIALGGDALADSEALYDGK